jgi:RNA polymerase sigma factor (sigma-70 family)
VAHDSHPLFDPEIAELIRRKARRFIFKLDPTCFDCEDVEQYLRAMLLQRLRGFDPAQGKLAAFVTTVLTHACANLVRDQHAKRRWPRPASLQATVRAADGDAGTLAATVEDRQSPCQTQILTDLRIDTHEALARLTPDDRDLVERLLSQTVAEIARELNEPRSTVQYRVRRLRQQFEKLGLSQYLPSKRSEENPPE